MKINWQKNNYQTFYAYTKISIGSKDSPIMYIESEDEFEFDGTTLRYSGAEMNKPSLRSVIEKRGWAGTEPNGHVKPFVVNRKVAKSKTVRTNMGATDIEKEDIMVVEEDDIAISRVKSGDERIADSISTTVMSNNDPVSDEGMVVGMISSSNNSVIDMSSGHGNTIETHKQVRMASDTSGEQKAKGGQRRVIRDGMIVGRISSPTRFTTDMSKSNLTAKAVENTVGTGRVIVEEQPERIVKPAAKKPAAKKPVAKTGSKVEIAKSIYSGFPDKWNLFGKKDWKIEQIKNYGEHPDFIRALYAIESKSMKKYLVSKYPNILK